MVIIIIKFIYIYILPLAILVSQFVSWTVKNFCVISVVCRLTRIDKTDKYLYLTWLFLIKKLNLLISNWDIVCWNPCNNFFSLFFSFQIEFSKQIISFKCIKRYLFTPKKVFVYTFGGLISFFVGGMQGIRIKYN